MPPITEFIEKEDGDDSDDDDLEVGGITQDYKCPLTLRTLENPVTSYVPILLSLSLPALDTNSNLTRSTAKYAITHSPPPPSSNSSAPRGYTSKI